MNEKNTLEDLFGQLRGSLDREEPAAGHRERFRERLGAGLAARPAATRRRLWVPVSIAASIALLLGAFLFMMRPEPSLEDQVAQRSPEVSKSTQYFANLVEQQVRELEAAQSPETRPLIEDTLGELRQLETDYKRMEADLLAGGNSKLILSAMITNFQTRIDLLRDVMQQIEQIKQFKSYTDESHTL